VIGRNDHKWGEQPILLVEMREDNDISDQDLLASLRGRVASWWIPDAVVRVPNMPLASTGKIDKIACARPLAGLSPRCTTGRIPAHFLFPLFTVGVDSSRRRSYSGTRAISDRSAQIGG